MALVTGPLHSDAASGAFAGSMVFASNRGRKYVRSLVTPSNPKSPSQTGVRVMMKYLSQLWSTIVAASGASWETIANSRNISKFNAFVSENLQRWQANNSPTFSFPAAGFNTTLDPDDVSVDGAILSAVGAAGYATLSAKPDSDGCLHGVGAIVYRGSAAPSGVWSEAIGIFAITPGTSFEFVDSPLPAGTYHYKIRFFSDDGVLGDCSAADVSAVVT